MTKALKVVMAAYGVAGIVFGLGYLIFPEQLSTLQGAEEVSDFLVAIEMTLGASVLAVGIFAVLAARDPIRNILWVQFAIVFALLFVATAVYSGVVLFADFNSALVGVTLHGVFAALLLILYPWGTRRTREQRATPESPHRGPLPGEGVTGTRPSALS
jgi:hypothetical protein